MKAAFLGNDEWSVPTLDALAKAPDVEVTLVVTNPARPAGRGSKLTPTPVAEAAQALGLRLVPADGVAHGAGREALRAQALDAIVVVAYGQLLPRDVLDLPRLGALNVHFSLLPRWRGAAPVQRAILAGDEVTGVSVMLLDEGLDTGPVLATEAVRIEDDDDAGRLGARLASVGARLLLAALRELEAGTATLTPQDHDAATVAPRLRPEERTIDWGDDAEAIVRRVRALSPSPGARTTFRGAPVKVLRARAVPFDRAMEQVDRGSVVVGRDGIPSVAAAGGSVALLEVAPAGRARMTGAEWARGARIGPGERCG